mmetsp:Transcript_25724/g.47004  ORF Transcript_25724/g.47004 Transcript_25724/m.47004 type:complete len:119 (+) Transcript_25724:52-408(+)
MAMSIAPGSFSDEDTEGVFLVKAGKGVQVADPSQGSNPLQLPEECTAVAIHIDAGGGIADAQSYIESLRSAGHVTPVICDIGPETCAKDPNTITVYSQALLDSGATRVYMHRWVSYYS